MTSGLATDTTGAIRSIQHIGVDAAPIGQANILGAGVVITAVKRFARLTNTSLAILFSVTRIGVSTTGSVGGRFV